MIAEINKHMLKFSILSHSIISYNPFTTTIVAVAANVRCCLRRRRPPVHTIHVSSRIEQHISLTVPQRVNSIQVSIKSRENTSETPNGIGRANQKEEKVGSRARDQKRISTCESFQRMYDHEKRCTFHLFPLFIFGDTLRGIIVFSEALRLIQLEY